MHCGSRRRRPWRQREVLNNWGLPFALSPNFFCILAIFQKKKSCLDPDVLIFFNLLGAVVYSAEIILISATVYSAKVRDSLTSEG